MGGMSAVKELLDFLRERKKWWLTPIVVLFLLLGLLVIFTQHSAVAPFIYIFY